MCFSHCCSLPFALLLITNSNYTGRQTKAEQLFGLFLATDREQRTAPEGAQLQSDSQSQSLLQDLPGTQRQPQSPTCYRLLSRPSFAAHFITMPLYSNPIIKRKTRREAGEGGAELQPGWTGLALLKIGLGWWHDFMFAARFHFRTW